MHHKLEKTDFSALGTPENKADFKYVIRDAQKSKHPNCSVFQSFTLTFYKITYIYSKHSRIELSYCQCIILHPIQEYDIQNKRVKSDIWI